MYSACRLLIVELWRGGCAVMFDVGLLVDCLLVGVGLCGLVGCSLYLYLPVGYCCGYLWLGVVFDCLVCACEFNLRNDFIWWLLYVAMFVCDC